jgi:hypothetical protein
MTDAEWAFAGALGAAVGAVTFYLVRVWLQREALSEGPTEPAELEAELKAELEAEREAELEAAKPEIELEAEGAERPPR